MGDNSSGVPQEWPRPLGQTDNFRGLFGPGNVIFPYRFTAASAGSDRLDFNARDRQ